MYSKFLNAAALKEQEEESGPAGETGGIGTTNSRAIPVQFHCNYCAIPMQFQCNSNAIPVQFQCNYCAIPVQVSSTATAAQQ